jgi:hypothetical protein
MKLLKAYIRSVLFEEVYKSLGAPVNIPTLFMPMDLCNFQQCTRKRLKLKLQRLTMMSSLLSISFKAWLQPNHAEMESFL